MCTCVEFKIPPTNGVAAIKINRKNSLYSHQTENECHHGHSLID